uniref:Disease resistance protein n=1 Tax=Solanum tuberosum TaxID=4113 RepID=M1BQW9_SOLTU
MAATYAALTSVLGTIDKLLRSNLLVGLEEVHKQQLESLDKMFGTLQVSLIGKCDGGDPIITKDLQRRIKDVALDAEDEVESLMKQLIIELDDDEQVLECCRTKLDKVSQQAIQVTDSVEELIIKQKINNCPEAGSSASPRLDASIRENVMEGYNEERERMVQRLTRGSGSNRQEVVSVVGMPGIGKTTFAKTILFENSIKRVFRIRGWITVSNNYDLRKLLLVLLRDVIRMGDGNDNTMDIGKLAERVQQGLKGEKYLIVVDDIWSKDAWDRISHWFPDCGNKSRILLTSRDREVGEYAATNPKDGLVLMRPLTQDESRCLFYHKAFGENYSIRGSDIDEFEKVGEKVITNCKGLPLMITAIAGILCSKSKLDEWMEVAQSVSSLVNDDDYKQCLKVVALSYNHLPSLMKACFLHFGVFPKAHVISVKKLIRLWIAEGLVNLKGVEEFEQVAARVLHDFIGKSLVIVDKSSLNGQIKTCRIHDLFHDFCSKEAESENLLYVVRSDSTTISQVHTNFRQGCRWMSVPSIYYSSQYTPIKIRSLYGYYKYFSEGLFHFKLLRVLDLEGETASTLGNITGDLVCLRYLSVMTHDTFAILAITNLWNLQTLILDKKSLSRIFHKIVTFPKEIWQMSQLRHLYSIGISLSSPGDKVLGNLQSVSGLSPRCCTKEIFEGIKKVKKLAIRGWNGEYPTDLKWIDNLKHLQDLESLSIEIQYWSTINGTRFFSLTSSDSFPQKLKKLKLSRTCLPWEYMSIISKLPELEVLKLKYDALVGDEWKATDQIGLPKLRFLLLANLNLEKWRTTAGSHDHFPGLECVIITNCKFLKEIPQGFADSKKLELIELHKCDPSLVAFAEKIQEKHEDLGRNKLKVTAFNSGKYIYLSTFSS